MNTLKKTQKNVPYIISRLLQIPIIIWLSLLLQCGFLVISLFTPLLAKHDVTSKTEYSLADANLPPFWAEQSDKRFFLGTDSIGRDIASMLLYGIRLSIIVGILSVIAALLFGCLIGFLAGYLGGFVDTFLMRIVDIKLALPAILIALMADGVARALISPSHHEAIAFPVLIFSIAFASWVLYARTVRSTTMIETQKEYVQAAHLLGIRHPVIIIRHVLPNVASPIFVISTVEFATAILLESTLSFLGVGLPPHVPSLGAMVREGVQFIYSGQWWLIFFPALILSLFIISLNLVADWLSHQLSIGELLR